MCRYASLPRMILQQFSSARKENSVKNILVIKASHTSTRILANRRAALVTALGICTSLIFSAAMLSAQSSDDTQPFLPNPVRTVSTIPANGDLNPYGVVFVPIGMNIGMLHSGDILVSNFNNSKNLQGTGTTIVSVPAKGKPTLFFHGPSGLGLSTALHVLKAGYVLVGNFPSTDGTCATAKSGSILVLSPWGKLVATISNKYIDGPWDSTIIDNGNTVTLFVANGLSGTVTRLVLSLTSAQIVQSHVQIGSGYMHQCDPVTFVDAPTGLVYNPKTGSLYVASTADNKVFDLHDAATTDKDEGTGQVLYADNTHLHGPLAMIAAPNGHLLVSNNDAINPDPAHTSEIVEFTIAGHFVKQLSVDPAPGGSFGLNVQTVHDVSTFAAVDDNINSLLIWTLPQQ
jgi:DNA-binding beta-propeller fold protein YncE